MHVSGKDKEEGNIIDNKEEMVDKEEGRMVKKEELDDVYRREVNAENEKQMVEEDEVESSEEEKELADKKGIGDGVEIKVDGLCFKSKEDEMLFDNDNDTGFDEEIENINVVNNNVFEEVGGIIIEAEGEKQEGEIESDAAVTEHFKENGKEAEFGYDRLVEIGITTSKGNLRKTFLRKKVIGEKKEYKEDTSKKDKIADVVAEDVVVNRKNEELEKTEAAGKLTKEGLTNVFHSDEILDIKLIPKRGEERGLDYDYHGFVQWLARAITYFRLHKLVISFFLFHCQ